MEPWALTTGSSGGYKENPGLVLGPDQQVNTRTACCGLLPPVASRQSSQGCSGGGAPEYLVVWEKEADLGTVTHSNFGGLQTSEWSAQMMPSILILREELRIL